MERVKFDNMRDWRLVVLIAVSLLCLLVGWAEPVSLENPSVYKIISSVGFFLQAVYFSRMFWYRNYVQWNKRGGNIKINSFFGHSFRFSEIKSVALLEDQLTIAFVGGKQPLTFDLSKVEAEDRELMKDILKHGQEEP